MKEALKLSKKKAGFFRFKRNGRGYLITNDFGYFSRLAGHDFKNFIGGRLDPKSAVYNELSGKLFIKDNFSLKAAEVRYRDRSYYLFDGPKLHIVVVTLRCNYKCVYCQANRRDAAEAGYDMSRQTAKNVVDRIFESPSKSVTIEFQGGEPLLNWPVLKFIVDYAKKKNGEKKKELRIVMVTNLSLMTDEIYGYLVKNNIHVCTSLDGPESLHNKNRPWPRMNSYKATIGWVKKIRREEKKRREAGDKKYIHRISALVTLTRSSLEDPKKIINEYIKYGFRQIHLRKLSFLGLSGGPARDVIGYTAEEFIDGWKRAMEYILKLNLSGEDFRERGTMIFLHKIIMPKDPGYLDLRSPCGAGVGQLAYNYNGKVYTCDEARTLEDDTFLLGDANNESYARIAACPKIKTMLLSSTLENFSCDECVYKTYCGICPVTNYVLHGSIFPQINQTDNCKINSAMLDYIFEKMEDKDTSGIFDRWVKTPSVL